MELTGYRRTEGELREIPKMDGWISPLLGIRFDLSGSELAIYGPDGRRFLTYQELAEGRDQLAQQFEAERQRNERLAAQLKAMGLEPPA